MGVNIFRVKDGISNLSTVYKVSHENEILSQMGVQLNTTTPFPREPPLNPLSYLALWPLVFIWLA